jgi:hypothetical protein
LSELRILERLRSLCARRDYTSFLCLQQTKAFTSSTLQSSLRVDRGDVLKILGAKAPLKVESERRHIFVFGSLKRPGTALMLTCGSIGFSSRRLDERYLSSAMS